MVEVDEMPHVLSTAKFGQALVAAGVISSMDRVTRLVVDARVGFDVTLYVERVGDERLLDVIPALVTVQVVQE